MSLTLAVIILLIAAVVIGFAGTALSRTGDNLADVTGLGEALVGGVLLGGTTSISGIITSVTAAYHGHSELAISNAIGGIAAQTVFLAIADIAYHRNNLEHSAASLPNIMQGVLLIGLLTLNFFIIESPEITVFHIHPGSIVLIIAYLAGLHLINQVRKKPMWHPKQTPQTVEDTPDRENLQLNVRRTWVKFVSLALVVGAAGYAVAQAGIAIAEQTGISEGFVGSILTAITTSLPELVVSISAVRQGALTMAVGNIIGGNTFDVLFVAFADMAYKGSILHQVTSDQTFIISLAMMMTVVLLLGLLHRQKKGIINIGWESLMLLLLYFGGQLLIYFY